MKYRVITVRNTKPPVVIDKYPVLEEYGFMDGVIELKTIEELTNLVKSIQSPVIISAHSCYGPKGAGLLEIYDEYRE